MPDQEAIQRGLAFEKYVAKVLGGKVQPGSGNKFYAQGDVTAANGLLVSCKSEVKQTWPKVLRHLSDAIDMAYQTGTIGVLALEDPGDWDQEPLVVMRLYDLARAFADEVKISNNSESKGIQKRSTAEIPLMLR